MSKPDVLGKNATRLRWLPTGSQALKIAGGYAFFSALWIFGSGWLLHRFVHDEVWEAKLENIKGWFFVAVTAMLLSWVLSRYFREIRRSAKQLQANEERLRLLGDNLPGTYVYQYITEANGKPRFTYVSGGVERVHGIRPSEALRDADCLRQLVMPESRPALAAAEQASVKNLTDFEVDVWIKNPDGKSRLMHLHAHPHPNDDGLIQWDGVANDVTESKKSELILHERERQLCLFVQHSPAAIAMVDAQMRYLLVSRRWISDYQLKEKELIGRSHYEIFPETPERWKEIHRRCLAGAVEKCDADPFPRADGSLDWVHWEIRPWHTDRGAVGGLIIFSELITARKQAEEALRRSESLLNDTGRTAKVGGWELDVATGVGNWTDEVARIHDLDSNVKPGKEMGLAFYHGESRAKIEAAVKAAIANATPYDLELEMISAKGVHKWIRTICHPLTENGKVVKLHGAFQDISDRKRAEAALRKSERLRQTIMDLVPHFIFVKDSHGRHLFVNRACAAANGLTTEQMVGKCDLDFVADRAQAEGFMRDDQEVIRSGKPKFVAEEILTDTAGVKKTLQTHKIPILAPNGESAVLGIAVDITELKQAQAALRASEERHRSIFESSRDGIIILDPACWRFTSGNPAALKMFGFKTEAEFLACGPADISTQRQPDGRLSSEKAQEVDEIVLRTGTAFFEWQHRRLDGEEFLADVLLTRIEFQGHPAILATVRDISERKRAETALQQSEEHFRAMFEVASIGMAQTDPIHGQWLRVNRKMCEITGYSVAELVGKKVRDLTHPDDRARDWDLFQRVILGEAPSYQIEKRYVCKDGSIAWVNVNMTAIRDVAGQPLRSMATIEDITERKKAEKQLRLQSAALGAAANAIVITDRDGQIEWVNAAFSTITGYPAEEAIGKNPRLFQSGEHDQPFYENLWNTILAGQTWHGELINRRKNGSLYNEDMIIAPLNNTVGEVSHFIAIKQDITQRKRLEAQFRQSQKMEAIGTLAGGVAHDFNNILTSILMQVELGTMETDLSAELREGFRQIRSDAERAASLTRQLLLFSRRQIMQSRVLDLNEVVTHLTKMLQRIIGEDVRLQLNLHPAPLMTHADAGMLDQVLMNLAVNARDAMPGGGRLVIETSEKMLDTAAAKNQMGATPGRHVCLSVSDTGGGIPADVLPRIFEPFFTTKEPGKGTGLGLATVFGIVNQHQGWVNVDSMPGHGTTFHVCLPAISAAEIHTAAAPAVKPRGGSETILLVEDEAPVRRTTRTILNRHGYQVLEAGNGVEALKVWETQREKVALLLTDMVMPAGISGLQLARKLQADQPVLKVIYTTGYSAEIAGLEIQLRNGENFMQKPFRPDELLKIVRSCLDG